MNEHIAMVGLNIDPAELLEIVGAGASAAAWVREKHLAQFHADVLQIADVADVYKDSQQIYAALSSFDMIMQKLAMQIAAAILPHSGDMFDSLNEVISALEEMG